MLKEERHRIIIDTVTERKILSIKDVSSLLDVSEATARRDIDDLTREGLVNRVYGGVSMLTDRQNKIVPLRMRDPENSKIKDLIAKRAAEMIPDGASVIIDGSSTARRIVKYTGNIKDLRIITNNTRSLREIAECNPDAEIYCTGGKYSPSNHVLVGSFAEDYLRGIMADYLFFSSQGVNVDGFITDISEEETAVRRVMLKHAKNKIFLCDSSKFGIQKLFTLCHIKDIDMIISDKAQEWVLDSSVIKALSYKEKV